LSCRKETIKKKKWNILITQQSYKEMEILGKLPVTHFTSTLELLLRATSPKWVSPESYFHFREELLYCSTVLLRIRSIV
jgi:hypothetical protein